MPKCHEKAFQEWENFPSSRSLIFSDFIVSTAREDPEMLWVVKIWRNLPLRTRKESCETSNDQGHHKDWEKRIWERPYLAFCYISRCPDEYPGSCDQNYDWAFTTNLQSGLFMILVMSGAVRFSQVFMSRLMIHWYRYACLTLIYFSAFSPWILGANHW
jgi:hypothetical protein